MKDVLLDEDEYFTEETDHLREFLTTLYKCILDEVSWGTTEIYYLSSGIHALSRILDRCWNEYTIWQEKGDQNPEAYGVDVCQPDFSDYKPDEHYPGLQALIWPKTRRERYKGNLILLSQHKVYSEFVFYESLFRYRSLREWKRLLNTWTSYALNRDKTILDDGKRTASSVFEDYLHLLKAVEMAWLNEKGEGNFSYHLKQPWFDMDNYPVFSTAEYIFNPYDELYGAFHSKTLMRYKTDLDKK